MNLRDLKPEDLHKIGVECDNLYHEWFKTSEGRAMVVRDGVSMLEPITLHDLWRMAFSHGARTILRRVNSVKENV